MSFWPFLHYGSNTLHFHLASLSPIVSQHFQRGKKPCRHNKLIFLAKPLQVLPRREAGLMWFTITLMKNSSNTILKSSIYHEQSRLHRRERAVRALLLLFQCQFYFPFYFVMSGSKPCFISNATHLHLHDKHSKPAQGSSRSERHGLNTHSLDSLILLNIDLPDKHWLNYLLIDKLSSCLLRGGGWSQRVLFTVFLLDHVQIFWHFMMTQWIHYSVYLSISCHLMLIMVEHLLSRVFVFSLRCVDLS